MPFATGRVSETPPVTRGEGSAITTTQPPRRLKKKGSDGVVAPMPITACGSVLGTYQHKSSIDWLGASILAPGVEMEAFIAKLQPTFGNKAMTSRLTGGLFGFLEQHRLYLHAGGGATQIGSISRGGNSQAGRWLIVLTGAGCSAVTDWAAFIRLIKHLSPRITRLDIALDFLDGEVTVDHVVAMYELGEFAINGRNPSSRIDGDWIYRKRGRTFYVGISKNGKMLRVYERGIKLGDLDSNYVRVEVQFTKRDRIIPLRAILEPDPYFAGAYPPLAKMLPVAARPIATKRKQSLLSLAQRLRHLKKSYGKTISEALSTRGATDEELVRLLRSFPMEDLLADANVEWQEVHAEVRKGMN